MSLIIGIDQLGDTVHIAMRRIKTVNPTITTGKVCNALVEVIRKEIEREVGEGLIDSAILSLDNDKPITI